MRIGVDFDNTIVCYDGVFYQAALERGWITADVADTKRAVRDYLRQQGREDLWTELQGLVYGPDMAKAVPYPGVQSFFQACRQSGIAVFIISHRTRTPYLGEPHDLHAAARQWLIHKGFMQPIADGLSPEQVFFEETREAKMARIAELNCSHFIDDLPEFIGDPAFPPIKNRILFAPNGLKETGPWQRAACWQEIMDMLSLSGGKQC